MLTLFSTFQSMGKNGSKEKEGYREVQVQASLGIKSLDEDGGRGDRKRWTILESTLTGCMGCGSENKTGHFYLSPKFSVTLQSHLSHSVISYLWLFLWLFSIVHVLGVSWEALGSREGLAPPGTQYFSGR